MLRIIPLASQTSSVVLRLEGKLLAPWTQEVRRVFEDAVSKHDSVSLDLSELTFADAAGQQLLRELLHTGAQLSGCSPYLAALLTEAKS